MESRKISKILAAKKLGLNTKEQDDILNTWLREDPKRLGVYNRLMTGSTFRADMQKMKEINWSNAYSIVRRNILKSSKFKFHYWRYIAASFAVFILLGSLFYWSPFKSEHDELEKVLPGKNNAIITFSTGERLQLSSTETGLNIDSTFHYEDGSKLPISKSNSIVYNNKFQIQTPRGGQYKLTLPDGSKVWMNADTKLEFNQNSDQREVYLSGEAYFEVAKSYIKNDAGFSLKRRPFIVKTNKQVIRVLGTHFNVESYPDNTKSVTTLLSGSLKVSTVDQSVILSPGEKAEYIKDKLIKEFGDVEVITAWKDGYFIFNNEPLESILKKVSRWYDTQIVFKDERLKTERFEAMLPRFSNLKDITQLIEKSGKVKFRYTDNVLYVSPL